MTADLPPPVSLPAPSRAENHASVELEAPPTPTPARPSDGSRTAVVHSEFRHNLLMPSPNKGASLIASTFNLANTIMGSGLLTLPSAFSTSGLGVGLVMAVAAAALNVLTLHQLSSAAAMRGVPPRATIGELAEVAMPGWGGLVIDLSISSYGLGVCTGYLIVFTDSLTDIIETQWRAPWTLLAVLLVTPLTLLRTLDALRYTSTMAIITILAAAIVIVTFATTPSLGACDGFEAHTVTCHVSLAGLEAGGDPPRSPCPGEVRLATAQPSDILRALAKFVLAYGCQQNILPIVGELHRPSTARTFTVELCSIGLALLVYTAVASAGYLTFGDSVCSNVLNSYPRNAHIAAVRAMIAAVVVTSYPLLAYEARRSILERYRVSCRHLACRARGQDAAGAAPASTSTRATKSSTSGSDGSSDSSGGGSSRGRISVHPNRDKNAERGLVRNWRSCFLSARDELIVAAIYVSTTAIVALCVSDLGVVLEFMGASAGVLITFVIPSACYVFLAPSWTCARVTALFTLVLGLILLPVSVAIEFMPHK